MDYVDQCLGHDGVESRAEVVEQRSNMSVCVVQLGLARWMAEDMVSVMGRFYQHAYCSESSVAEMEA